MTVSSLPAEQTRLGSGDARRVAMVERIASALCGETMNYVEKVLEVERFRKESLGIDLARALAGVLRRGHDDDWCVGSWLHAICVRKRPAIHRWHPHVQKDEPRVDAFHTLQSHLPIGRGRYLIALINEHLLDEVADIRIIVDDQDRTRCCPHRSLPR